MPDRRAGRWPDRRAPWLAAIICSASASHLMSAIGIPRWPWLAVALNVILVLALALAWRSIGSVDRLLVRLGAHGVGWFNVWVIFSRFYSLHQKGGSTTDIAACMGHHRATIARVLHEPVDKPPARLPLAPAWRIRSYLGQERADAVVG